MHLEQASTIMSCPVEPATVFFCSALSSNSQHSTRGGSKASAAFHIAPGGAAVGTGSSSSQQQQRLPFSSLQSQGGEAAGSSAAAASRSAEGTAGRSNDAGSSKAPNYESLDYELVENTGVRINVLT
jgi:hypothetical protein